MVPETTTTAAVEEGVLEVPGVVGLPAVGAATGSAALQGVQVVLSVKVSLALTLVWHSASSKQKVQHS